MGCQHVDHGKVCHEQLLGLGVWTRQLVISGVNRSTEVLVGGGAPPVDPSVVPKLPRVDKEAQEVSSNQQARRLSHVLLGHAWTFVLLFLICFLCFGRREGWNK